MSVTPSARRRKGCYAFYRGGNPADLNPYPRGSSDAGDWLVGWLEAEKEDGLAIAREVEADHADFDKVIEFARLYNLAKEQGLIS